MNNRVLFVDDEPNMLEAITRKLRNRFDVHTAVGGDDGLRVVREQTPFAVVVSDMKMPGIDGITFLARVRVEAPSSVRMVLSGQADLESAIAAVNDGNVFRFLTKPCAGDVLIRGIEAGLEQYRLITAERELLDRTLSGSVKVLTEVLALASPETFSRATRIQKHVEEIVESLGVEREWEFRMAGLLSQIGCVSLPSETLAKIDRGESLSELETEMFREHPRVAGALLSRIPRLETVARMVADQMTVSDVDPATAIVDWDPLKLGAQILRVVTEFDRLVTAGISPAKALERLRAPAHRLPRAIVDALARACSARLDYTHLVAQVCDLWPKMIFNEDVNAKNGVMLARKGQEVTDSMIARLHNFAVGVGVVEPIQVLVAR